MKNFLFYYNIFGFFINIAGFILVVKTVGWLAAAGIFLLIWANNIMLACNGRLNIGNKS